MIKRTFLILVLAGALYVIGTIGWFFFGDTIQEHFRRRPFDSAVLRGEKVLTNDVPFMLSWTASLNAIPEELEPN